MLKKNRLTFALVFLAALIVVAGVAYSRGYWDWDVKQIHTLKAYQIRPPETPGNNYPLNIGQASRDLGLVGDIDATVTDTAVADEDDMSSNSATMLATQQSIKAYVDSGTVTMTNKTLSSPTISGTITGTGVVSATNIADVVRYIPLSLVSFVSSIDGAPLTTSSGPGFEIDDSISNIVFADGETTPILVTFRVPSDYASGGAFNVIATESDSTTPNQIDFDVYINSDGTAADAAATGQTPVALAGTTSTPDEVTLTVATDFASLAAGNWVTLRIWRDDTADGTGALEVKGVAFYYTASQ